MAWTYWLCTLSCLSMSVRKGLAIRACGTPASSAGNLTPDGMWEAGFTGVHILSTPVWSRPSRCLLAAALATQKESYTQCATMVGRFHL